MLYLRVYIRLPSTLGLFKAVIPCSLSLSSHTLLHVFETLCEIPVLSRWKWADLQTLCSCKDSLRLLGSPGSLFHPPNWCLQQEMTLSAGFAILNQLKPMWSHPFTLRGILIKCATALKANEHGMLEWEKRYISHILYSKFGMCSSVFLFFFSSAFLQLSGFCLWEYNRG